MSTRTQLGFIMLAPGEPLSTDNYAFLRDNPKLSDLLGRLGAFTHRHDAHAGLADPTADATLAVISTGGTVPAGTTLQVAYTLIDGQGGESLPSPVVTDSLPGGYADPTTAPTATLDTTAGALLANTWSYAATVTDGVGGETALGPAATLVIPSGSAHNQAQLSGLTALTDASSGGISAAGWRLWRSVDGSPWYLIATGSRAVDNFTDNGVAGDCSIQPPSRGSTGGSGSFTITVPAAGQPAGAVYFNLYASASGALSSPCFLSQHPVADFGTAVSFTALVPQDGEPPTVSRCYPGANKINPDTDMLDFPYKGTVADTASLPAIGNADGDVRVVLSQHLAYIWDNADTVWRPLALAARVSITTPVTGLPASTETAETLTMPGKGSEILAVTVDQACRLRLYPRADLAAADIARAASSNLQDWAAANCLFEHTFAAAGTYYLTPAIVAANMEDTPAANIATNISSASATVNVTLVGYAVEL